MSLVLIAIFVTLSVLFYYALGRRKGKNYPPGPPMWKLAWIVLTNHQNQTHKVFKRLAETYGDTHVVSFPFSSSFFQKRMVILNGWAAFEDVFFKNREFYNGRYHAWATDLLSERKGLLYIENALWRVQKRFVKSGFKEFGYGRDKMELYIEEQSEDLVKCINEILGQDINAKLEFQMQIINSVWRLVTGECVELTKDELRHIAISIDKTDFITMFAYSFLSPVFTGVRPQIKRLHYVKKLTNAMFSKVIKRHRETLDRNNPRDFIDLFLLEIEKQPVDADSKTSSFTEPHLLQLMFDIFEGGLDTSSSVLSFMMMYLCNSLDIQKEIQDEIDTVLGNTVPRYGDRTRLVLTEAALLETLRLVPAIGLAGTETNSVDCKLLGYDIDKGSCIVPNLWAMHREEKYYPDAHNFKPKRFINAEGKIVRPKNYFPFGTGKRMCIGEALAVASLFLFLVNIMQNFNVRFSSNHPKPDIHDTKYDVLLYTPDHFVVFEKRIKK